MPGHARQWALFAAWGVAGASLTLIVSQIAFFTVPAGLVLLLVLLRYGGNEEALGLFAGAGAVATVIGVLNLGYHPCPRDGPVVLPPGQTSYECGGFDGTPWLILGAALMTAAVVGFALLRRS
jgi:hypothetical protein